MFVRITSIELSRAQEARINNRTTGDCVDIPCYSAWRYHSITYVTHWCLNNMSQFNPSLAVIGRLDGQVQQCIQILNRIARHVAPTIQSTLRPWIIAKLLYTVFAALTAIKPCACCQRVRTPCTRLPASPVGGQSSPVSGDPTLVSWRGQLLGWCGLCGTWGHSVSARWRARLQRLTTTTINWRRYDVEQTVSTERRQIERRKERERERERESYSWSATV